MHHISVILESHSFPKSEDKVALLFLQYIESLTVLLKTPEKNVLLGEGLAPRTAQRSYRLWGGIHTPVAYINHSQYNTRPWLWSTLSPSQLTQHIGLDLYPDIESPYQPCFVGHITGAC